MRDRLLNLQGGESRAQGDPESRAQNNRLGPLAQTLQFYANPDNQNLLITPNDYYKVTAYHVGLTLFCLSATLTYLMTSFKASFWGLYDEEAPYIHYWVVACTLVSAAQVLYNTFSEFVEQEFLHVPEALENVVTPHRDLHPDLWMNLPGLEILTSQDGNLLIKLCGREIPISEKTNQRLAIIGISALVSVPIVAAFYMFPINGMTTKELIFATIFLQIINTVAHTLPVRLVMKTPPYNKITNAVSNLFYAAAFPLVLLYEIYREANYSNINEIREQKHRAKEWLAHGEKVKWMVQSAMMNFSAEALAYEFTQDPQNQSYLRKYRLQETATINEQQLPGVIRNYQGLTIGTLLGHHYAGTALPQATEPGMNSLQDYMNYFKKLFTTREGLGWLMGFITATGCLGYMLFSFELIQSLHPTELQALAYVVDTPSVVCFAVLLVWIGRGGFDQLTALWSRHKVHSALPQTDITPLAAKLYPLAFRIGLAFTVFGFTPFAIGSAQETMLVSAQNLTNNKGAINTLLVSTTVAITYLALTTAIEYLNKMLTLFGEYLKEGDAHQVLLFVELIIKLARHLEDTPTKDLIDELKHLPYEEVKAVLPRNTNAGEPDHSALNFEPSERKAGCAESIAKSVVGLFKAPKRPAGAPDAQHDGYVTGFGNA